MKVEINISVLYYIYFVRMPVINRDMCFRCAEEGNSA